jgi:hypothetical protein
MNTVKIDGVDYPYFGMTDDRRGIITEDRTFWMFPDCYADGRPVTELPRIGPREIKRVSFDEPDLTETYLEEVKAGFERYLDYWRKITPEEHAKKYGLSPGRERDEEESAYAERVKQWLVGFRPQFEDDRQRLLAVPFDDYRRNTGKKNAWIRHGTPELAEKYGFRQHMNLYLGMYVYGSLKGVNQKEIIPRIFALCYEAHYPDPEGTVIFLKDLLLDKHTPAVLRHVGDMRDPSAQERQEIESQGGASARRQSDEAVKLLAQAQRTLSSGVLLNGPGTKDMTESECLLFNLLREDNPKRKGWALSYREIGRRLNVSHTEVDRMRRGFEARHAGTMYVRAIAEAREKNDKGRIAPDLCDSGRQIKTKNPPENPSEPY